MKTVFLLSKRVEYTGVVISPVLATAEGDRSPWGLIITECELVKETPKGWKVIPQGCRDPRFVSASDSDLFSTAAEAAEVLREKLEAAKVVAQRHVADLDRAIGECTAIEVEAE